MLFVRDAPHMFIELSHFSGLGQAYFWNISTLIPGIPVLAIMVRYNLQNSGVVGPKLAFFFGVVAPWLVTMFCYQASMLVSICDYNLRLTFALEIANSPNFH